MLAGKENDEQFLNSLGLTWEKLIESGVLRCSAELQGQ